MSTYYKDFASLNTSLTNLGQSQNLIRIQTCMAKALNISALASKLPSDWARSYAGVMVLKYDAGGNPTDVTPTVTGSGITIPDSILCKALSDVDSDLNQIKADREVINNAIGNTPSLNDLFPALMNGEILFQVGVGSNTGPDYIGVAIDPNGVVYCFGSDSPSQGYPGVNQKCFGSFAETQGTVSGAVIMRTPDSNLCQLSILYDKTTRSFTYGWFDLTRTKRRVKTYILPEQSDVSQSLDISDYGGGVKNVISGGQKFNAFEQIFGSYFDAIYNVRDNIEDLISS